MKKFIVNTPVWLIFLLLQIQICSAQTTEYPYNISFKKELTIGGIGGAGFITSKFLQNNKKLLTVDVIQTLKRNDIWPIDRPATYNWSPRAANLSDVFLYSSVLLPALHLIPTSSRNDITRIAVLQADVLLLTSGLTYLTKEIVQRRRPYNYNPDAPMRLKLETDATASFFSGHTSVTSAMCFFYAQTFAHYNQNSPLKPLVFVLATLYPAITGYLRWQAGKHFFTDIVAGYIVGAAIGIAIPQLSKKTLNRTP